MKKEKKRAAKDRKICDIYIQSLQFSIQQSVQEEEEKDKWKKMWREIRTGKRQIRPASQCQVKIARTGNNGSSSSEWEGKHKVLVRTRGHKSKYFVVDLQKDIIEMQNPYRLLGDGSLGSTAVFLEEEDRMIMYEFGGLEEDTFNNFKETKDDDIILHSFSVTLGNKIFAFGGITQVGQVYDTSKSNPEWEDMTFPFLYTPAADFSTGELPSRCPTASHPVMSDPKNNRLILYFEDHSCLYAYYPDNDKESQWECLDNDLKTLPCWNQLLVDDVIYYFGSPYAILAYDITQRKWFNVSWPQKKLRDCDMFFKDMTKMIHLGDESVSPVLMMIVYNLLPSLPTGLTPTQAEDGSLPLSSSQVVLCLVLESFKNVISFWYPWWFILFGLLYAANVYFMLVGVLNKACGALCLFVLRY
ncbi:hypothetical protein QL285_017666 [Trifolium repens]|nr:hypothetical protein QL285_017666 [Trifolium repens]